MSQYFRRLAAMLGAGAIATCCLSAGCGDDDDANGLPTAGSGGAGPGAGSGGAAQGGGGGGAADPCAGLAKCVRLSPGMSESDIKEQFILAQSAPGTTLAFEPGTYRFRSQLSLFDARGITVRGAGRDQTVLDFSAGVGAGGGAGAAGAGGATGGGASEGIYVNNNDDFVIEKLTVRDTPGDAIKVLGSRRVTFRDVGVLWTGADPSQHGAYGLYPVECEDVLVEGSRVEGASDAGVYVGQSNRVVVRRNTATKNVAGIEIENTTSADVYENTAEGNTGGLLVFSLPGLTIANGGAVRLYDNVVRDNNEPNFAPPGNIVGLIPAGTGTFVMASHDVEAFNNTFRGNQTTQFAVISYLVSRRPDYQSSPAYDPYPSKVYVHDNAFEGGGAMPDSANPAGLGALLKTGMTVGKLPTPLPPLMVDGFVPAAPLPGAPAGNPTSLCFANNTGATGVGSFANLNMPTLLPAELPDDFPSWQPQLDAAPYACTLAALPAVSLPQLAPP